LIKIKPLNTKIIYALLFLSFSLFSCKNNKKNIEAHAVFTITGNLQGYSPQNITLQEKANKEYTTLLSATQNADNFILSSTTKLPLDLYYLKVDKQLITLLIDNTNLNVNLKNSKVTGESELQKTYANFVLESKQANNLFIHQKKFVEEHSNSKLAAVILKDMLGNTKWRLEQTEALYQKLATPIKTSNIGRYITSYITKGLADIPISKDEDTNMSVEEKEDPKPVELIAVKEKNKTIASPPKPKSTQSKVAKTKKRRFTEYAPFFFANNLKGNEVGLKNILDKNKVILIDFWASWCVPCRAQNPDFVKLYTKYHAKGFEIVSVSQDKDLENCKNAVNQDNMTWVNLIDNRASVANMYKVGAIPDAFLVNSQGGIIAKDVGSGKLERLLKAEYGF